MLKVRNLEDIKLVKLDNTKLEDILEPIENEIEMLRSIRIFFFLVLNGISQSRKSSSHYHIYQTFNNILQSIISFLFKLFIFVFYEMFLFEAGLKLVIG